MRQEGQSVVRTRRSAAVDPVPPLVPPDLERHVVVNTPVEQIWKYLNLPMLFAKNLGFRGSFAKALERGDEKAVVLMPPDPYKTYRIYEKQVG